MSIAEDRFHFFATELAALGCRVTVEEDADGSRSAFVSGASWFDADNVTVRFTPASAKQGKGRRDSLYCMIFSNRKYPRKHYATVEFHEALRHAAGLKDYTAHTHCEPARHHCGEARCIALHQDGKVCRLPESLHWLDDSHTFRAS